MNSVEADEADEADEALNQVRALVLPPGWKMVAILTPLVVGSTVQLTRGFRGNRFLGLRGHVATYGVRLPAAMTLETLQQKLNRVKLSEFRAGDGETAKETLKKEWASV